MATRIVIKELNKKKDELTQFINKLEEVIKKKQNEIFHIENTITIFENSSQNDEKLKEENNPNIIKHDFKNSSEIEADNKISQNIKNAIDAQKRQSKKIPIDEKVILKQFKQLIKSY